MKKQYYLLVRDSYGQPSGMIEPVMLTEAEYEEYSKYEYLYEDYIAALYRAMD